MRIIKLSEWGELLGSRQLGEIIRKEIERALHTYGEVTVDFTGIDIISHSFADECFGKLVLSFGTSVFRTRLHLVNIPEQVRPILRYVVHERIKAA